MTPRFPHVKVQLTGTDGNAFAVLAKVRKAMRQAGVPAAEIDAFVEAATKGDYDNLLRVCMQTVEVR